VTGLLFYLEGLRRGPTAEAIVPAWLLVVDGEIIHVGSLPPPNAPSEVLFAQGGWAIEPLADAHVHLVLNGAGESARRDPADLFSERDETQHRVLCLLEDYRRQGIAAVRDGGDPSAVTLAAAPLANADPGRYAALLPSGGVIRREGSYGSFLGRGVGGVQEATRLLHRNRELGATHAKILATGLNSLDRAGSVGPPQFSAKELAVICREAWSLGTAPMIHANGPMSEVLEAGPGTVEHGFWLDPEDLATMARRAIGWTPTLGAWAELESRPGLTEIQRSVVRQTDARHRDEVRRGWRLGVSILAGSDAGSPGVSHQGGLCREIARLQESGFTNGAGLATSTWGSRTLCEAELGRPLGGLNTGGPAGFLWLAADPVQFLNALSRPQGVYLGGCWTSGVAGPLRPMTMAEVRSCTEET